MLVIFVASQNGIVALTPKELPEAAYKIFAGPGLIIIGNRVTSHKSTNSIFMWSLKKYTTVLNVEGL